mmetsp:Transcript_19671/g.45874  ORF Transcript_19671/g.45874 Transcript_19671/m.45874 type:complete len:84 (-) Transcript_19671:8-259(-)
MSTTTSGLPPALGATGVESCFTKEGDVALAGGRINCRPSSGVWPPTGADDPHPMMKPPPAARINAQRSDGLQRWEWQRLYYAT